MEDIEYLEEYEDFILPKTLNYSEEFPVNTIEGGLLNETCNNFNPELPTIDPEYEENMPCCSPLQNTKAKKSNLIKIINTEVIKTPSEVQNIIKGPSQISSITQESQQPQYRCERQSTPFLDRISQNTGLQRLDKFKCVATVKPTLQKTKTFKLSAISPPFVSTDAKFQTISSLECMPKLDVNVSNKVLDDDSFLDYAVEKHAVDGFNMDFNLDTAEISDICSDSLNFSDDYNEDIFCLDSLLSSEDNAKQKLKRKSMPDTVSEVDHKKFKYGNNLNSSKHIQKSGKHVASEIFSKKSLNVEKKKSQNSFDKRKVISSGKQSKLVVKKNGKKFVFPDRSKFSLKKLTCSNNVEDEIQSILPTKKVEVTEVRNVTETNADLVNYSCAIKNNLIKSPSEKQIMKSPTNYDQEKLKEKDIVIFSSPRNMKRIDSELPIYQSHTTPNKSTNISFGHFSLKSIKPPSNLRIKEMLPKQSALPHSESKDTDKILEDKASKASIESEVGTQEKDAIILQDTQPLPNLLAPCSKEKETHEHNLPVLSPENKGKQLITMDNVSDNSIGENCIPSEKPIARRTSSNNREENTNIDSFNDLNEKEVSFEKHSEAQLSSKTTISNKIFSEPTNSIDSILKDTSVENEPNSNGLSSKETALETLSSDLDSNIDTNKTSLENSVTAVPRNVNENRLPAKENTTGYLRESSMEKSLGDENYLKTNLPKKNESLQESNKVLDNILSTNFNTITMETNVRKSPNKKNESKCVKQTNNADRVLAKSLENILKTSVSGTPLVEETANKSRPQLECLFEPRGFDIRLGKNIVAKILKTAKSLSNSEAPKLLDEFTHLTKPDIVMQGSNLRSPTIKHLQRLSTDSAENTGIKTKGKRGRKKKNIQSTASEQSGNRISSLLSDCTEKITSDSSRLLNDITPEKEKQNENVQSGPSGLENEKSSSTQNQNLAKDDPKRCPTTEIIFDGKESTPQKPSSILITQPKVLAVATSEESRNTNDENVQEESILLKKNTRLLKSNSQPKPNVVSTNVNEKRISPRKDSTSMSDPLGLSGDCISFQAPPQQKSTKGHCDTEIVEPKKEKTDETVAFQFRSTNLLSNDPFLNKVKLNGSPDISINKTITDTNRCASLINTFGNQQINPKFTIFELPAFIVMKTKIVTRKDLETNTTLKPPVIKQQIETDSDDLGAESVIKTERPEFSSVCARINSLLEQNANYLKFASGSERLTRMNDVLSDYSLSVEDANCTLKFLQSYLSSGPRDKAIKTRGQQFIPIYDSQKKIIGYRKRTIHVKPLSSRRSSKRMSKVNAQSNVSVATVNINRNSHRVENPELPPKIEPNFLDVGESELIVPDTSPANDVCIKHEEDNIK